MIACSYHSPRVSFVKKLFFTKLTLVFFEVVKMKEWIKKVLIILIIFVTIYFVLYKFVNIDENLNVPESAKVITMVNKKQAIAALSVIGTSIILEITAVIMFINKTVSPETFRINLVKLIALTLTFLVISGLSYYIYLLTSVTRISFI